MSNRKKDFFKTYDYSILEQTPAKCIHFGTCGGCSLQKYTYASQIKLKEEFLKDTFDEEVKVKSSKNQFGYRNRMDFVYTQSKLGLRKKEDYSSVVEINCCELMPDFMKNIFLQVKEELKKYEIESYDSVEHIGFLRYVVFRYSLETKQTMIIFTSTSPSKKQEDKMNLIFEKLKSIITSIYWFHYNDITDVTVPNMIPAKIIGEKNILEQIGDKKYLVSPWSFFQVNTPVAKEVFDKIKLETKGNCVDLCCGVGAITIYVAEKSTSIIGIEQISQAIDMANQNKILNQSKKPLFFTGEMKNFLSLAPLEIDTLILDPPRAGLDKKICERVIKSHPKKIIYMSCNPKTQKIDLDYLKENYKIISIEGWDMFPQTPHVETLVILERIEEEKLTEF